MLPYFNLKKLRLKIEQLTLPPPLPLVPVVLERRGQQRYQDSALYSAHKKLYDFVVGELMYEDKDLLGDFSAVHQRIIAPPGGILSGFFYEEAPPELLASLGTGAWPPYPTFAQLEELKKEYVNDEDSFATAVGLVDEYKDLLYLEDDKEIQAENLIESHPQAETLKNESYAIFKNAYEERLWGEIEYEHRDHGDLLISSTFVLNKGREVIENMYDDAFSILRNSDFDKEPDFLVLAADLLFKNFKDNFSPEYSDEIFDTLTMNGYTVIYD